MRNARYFAGAPGEPSRASQRHTKPPTPAVVSTFAPGDAVAWNSRYTGTVEEVFGTEALVREINSPLGGQRTWRLSLDALTRR